MLREEEWDIKISDYIFEHYKTKQLFYDLFHISDILVKEITKRLLIYLGYNGEVHSDTLIKLDGAEIFLYRDVRDFLEIEYEQKYIRKHTKSSSLTNIDMDLKEYVNQLYRYVMFSIR